MVDCKELLIDESEVTFYFIEYFHSGTNKWIEDFNYVAQPDLNIAIGLLNDAQNYEGKYRLVKRVEKVVVSEIRLS